MSCHVQVCCPNMSAEASLTQTEQDHGRLGKRRARRREVELWLGPPEAVLVEPGQDVVPAKGFGVGHQLLLCQRAVKHIQDLCGEDGGPTQDFHVLLLGWEDGVGSGWGGGIWVKWRADLRSSCVCSFIPEELGWMGSAVGHLWMGQCQF